MSIFNYLIPLFEDFYLILHFCDFSFGRDDRRTQYDFQAERQYYENVRTTGTYTDDPRRKYPARSREFYTEWDPYQGDYYDSQYFEDPREYREYRADPYEQDIRKYSYLQRERERERERFETDRGREHGRRTIERSQSPSHIASRRPASPTASPSLSERIPSDSDRRICCRSSERSGSCSSVSPPRFEKLEKARTERYNKTEKLEKDRLFDVDRGTLVEKEKRAGRKDRAEKDKSEKQRLKKLKVSSPVLQPCEMETELETEVSPDAILRNKSSKTSKEGTSKGRLDLLPCVVQLTRVKEKEGKLIGHSLQEKQNVRGGIDSPRIVLPSADQRSPPFRTETLKSDISKHGKVHRDKNSLLEFVDKDAKIKSKKHGKSEIGFDSSISVDIDRLAARKRRFEDSGKGDRLKRSNEEELLRRGLHKVWNSAKETDLDKNFLIKGMPSKDHQKDKSVRLSPINSPKDARECENESLSISSVHQSQLGEVQEDCTDELESPYLKMDLEGSKIENSSTKLSDDGILDLDEMKEQKHVLSENKQNKGKYRGSDDGYEHTSQNDASKHIEQTRWLKPNFSDHKSVKFENPPPSHDTCDSEKDFMINETVKSSQELPTDDISCKRKKYESFDFEIAPLKRDCSYSITPKSHEEIYQNETPSISQGHCSVTDEDETSPVSLCKTGKEIKCSLTSDDVFSNTETSKRTFGLTATHFQSSERELPKLKTNILGCDDELMQRWARRMKSDSVGIEMNFSSDITKHEGIQKCLGQDLEPGEVQSDSDDDSENKLISTKSSSSLSYILRERDERMSDLKLSGSLEKNKFYSFALDKTITPDTKALLERAKTLYSSREDNWSFLPSRFPTSHSCTDKDKVELTPRPIPSWYMKKKKIRTGSDEKLVDKKEDLKPQDQERQDLFASRFLHSSIFEQDSRRLQHLERKDVDLETGVGRQFLKHGSNEVQPESAISDVLQEPKVLFHSRFLELQQQKDKDHLPIDSENEMVLIEIKTDDTCPSDKECDPVVQTDDKSVSPPVILSVSPCLSSPKELSSPKKKEFLSPSSESSVPFVKIENEERVPELSHSLNVEVSKPVTSKLILSPPPVLSETENDIETKSELVEQKVKVADVLVVEHNPTAEDKPSIPGCFLSGVEKRAMEFVHAECSKVEEKPEIIKLEPKIENQETKHSEESLKTEADSEMCMPELEAEIKPIPSRRQTKSKRSKQLSGVRTSQPSQVVPTEKPATRKSERIDREKLKRASSPRAEAAKALSETKTTAKSPIHASDSEPNLESSLIHGRTRRRNVRSVYATLHEDDQAGKEVVESSRSMRKRGVDKEPIQQDIPTPPTNHARRGRPPKRGVRRLEDVSPVKGDQQKIVEEETEGKEASICVELVKVSEGWRSPRTQKLQQTQIASPIPMNKKGSRPDKQSGSTLVMVDNSEIESQDELKLENKDDSEQFSKLSEKVEHTSSLLQSKEKDNVKDTSAKSIIGTGENVDSICSERKQQPEKGVKVKIPRLKRNSKQSNEEKSHSLKNLEIRVSVDDVKGLLRPEDDTPEALKPQNPPKNKIVLQENQEIKIAGFVKDSKQSSVHEKEDSSSEPEPPPDPAALLARQMELERAVENIAKLAVEQAPRTYKEQPTRQPVALPPAIIEPEVETEEEKRANPASETELAAAIDSITAEETCTDADSFTTHPTYSALIPTSDSVSSSSSNEIMEPETHMVINNILAADSDDSSLAHSPSRVLVESKVPEEAPQLEMPKKTGKVKAKAPKKQRGRKGGASKKGEITERPLQPDSSPVKLPESIPEDPEIIKSKAVTVAGATVAASVVTAVATCRRDVTSAITVDTPKEAEQPDVEQPVPKESAFHSSTSNSSSKKHPPVAESCTPTLASISTGQQPISQFSVPLLRPAKMPLSPDWPTRTEESRIYVAPSCHVTVVTPSAPPPASLGAASTNPPKPPDTKASDIDSSSSTLRKILMEPKYVSASNSKSVPTTMVTSALSDPLRMSENENPSEPLVSRPLHSEERSALSLQSIHHKPFPLTESQQNSGERTQHTVISPTTSVISRIPLPYDTEETPRISLSNRSTGLPMLKQKFRTHSNENNRYHGNDIVEESNRGRSVVESSSYSTGSAPGLRVNTSEGVVVLSYSGQKTEGPHRMRAKISQIPQASAGDLEFQQSVTKSSLKQDPLNTPSQSPTPKVSSSPAYGHTGVLLTGQSYNAQPVISSTKQESLGGCDKSDGLYHTASQGGVVKMFQQPVSSPPVLMYNQAVIQQHSKRSLPEPATKKIDIGKTVQQSNLSPVMSPHHPSSGTRMSPSPGIQPDRLSGHLKQEPQSPRTTVHSPLPFVKSCPPNSSPRATSVVLGHGISPMSSYHSSVHHPHSEPSSVIMQPHSVNQAIAHEPRMNAQPGTGINYGRRNDPLSSAHPVPPQRSNTPQPNAIRDIVLQSHSSTQGSVKGGGGAASIGEEDSRHFNQALSRPSVPQLKSEVMMIHGDHRGLHPGIRMDQYRDMHQRILMHQQLGDQSAVEARQSRTLEMGTATSTNISGHSKSRIVGKNIEVSTKEPLKPLEGKLIHPSSTESRIRGVHSSSPIMVSPHTHGVPLMCQGSVGSYPVYREIRGFPSQFSGHTSSGHGLANQGITSSQVY